MAVCVYSDQLENGTSYQRNKLAKHGLTFHGDVRRKIWWSNSSDISPEQLYEEISWTIDDLVDRIEFIFKENILY